MYRKSELQYAIEKVGNIILLYIQFELQSVLKRYAKLSQYTKNLSYNTL